MTESAPAEKKRAEGPIKATPAREHHSAEAPRDWRLLENGREIPTEFYCDQPYVVQTDDGAWLCVVTTGPGREGKPGQHIAALRSTDQGRTWSEPVPLEPPGGPEASYAVLLKTPRGRIYAFYNHNTDNIRRVKADPDVFPDGYCYRVDSLGHYVFKFSDDQGRTWSAVRYPVPIRVTDIDRENVYGGKLQFFWNVGKPFVHGGAAYVPLHKVGKLGEGVFARSEGALLKSRNILHETQPEKIEWETLPEGETGLRTPPGGGPVAEEQSFVVLSDGTFYSVYRTVDGHPACSLSRDQGRSWSAPQYQCYGDGRRMKQPRAANFVWKCSNGRYLYWFHNHGGRDYDDRNPAWLCGGIEADTPQGKTIRWSQPEIVLYDDDTYVRMSYPDLVEQDGRYFLTETQKHIARVHEIPARLLEALWGQFDRAAVVEEGCLLQLDGGGRVLTEAVALAPLPRFTTRDRHRPDYGTLDRRAGFSIDLWVCFSSLEGGQILLDTRRPAGQGIALVTTPRGTVEVILNDGRTENRWDCDPGVLQVGRRHHIAVIVDGGPKIISFVIDGRLNDGGEQRQFGWGRFSPNLHAVNGDERLRLARQFQGEIYSLRIYNRYLLTSEAISNYRAGCGTGAPCPGKVPSRP